MVRALPLSILAFLILAPLSLPVLQTGTPAPTVAISTTDPETIAEALATAGAPDSLPGNVNTEIEMVAWEDFYGESLDQTVGAWVFTGSPDLPIATLIVFASPESAQSGIADYREETASGDIDGLDTWSVADRGKWLCIEADGPVVILGQAEPQPDETDEEVQRRACDVIEATHAWMVDQLSVETATPEAATPGSQ